VSVVEVCRLGSRCERRLNWAGDRPSTILSLSRTPPARRFPAPGGQQVALLEERAQDVARDSEQRGGPAGISQTTNGVSNLTQPEKFTAYEWGVKSILLGRTLTHNADVFLNNIRNYQQAVEVFDAYTTALNEFPVELRLDPGPQHHGLLDRLGT
jgi:TonB dependent receptor